MHVGSVNRTLPSMKMEETVSVQEPAAILTVKPDVHDQLPCCVTEMLFFLISLFFWWQWLPLGSLNVQHGEESQQLQQHQSERDAKRNFPSHHRPLPENRTPSPGWCSPSPSPDLLDSLACKQRSQRCLWEAVLVPETSKGWIFSPSPLCSSRGPEKLWKLHPWGSSELSGMRSWNWTGELQRSSVETWLFLWSGASAFMKIRGLFSQKHQMLLDSSVFVSQHLHWYR